MINNDLSEIQSGILYEVPEEALPDISDACSASSILFNSYWYRLWNPQHDFMMTYERSEYDAY